jgi:glycosyltransferase involved in cell wall biosynthesis
MEQTVRFRKLPPASIPHPAPPLVSVITPVLNAANTLELTLSSVAAQTYPNLEHIVVDGGSRDGTIGMLRKFQSTVPLRWLSEPDEGMYAAINKGIKLARGETLSYLNSDDLYLPWSVERGVSALMTSAADLAFGDLLLLFKQSGHGRRVGIQFFPRFRPRTYAYEVSLGQPTVFWRRRVTDAVGGFDDQLRYAGDFEYWLRTATAGFRYRHIPEVLAVAVQHDRALSTAHADELQMEIEQTRARYADAVKPRRFARFRSLTHAIHWRSQVLMFRLSLAREHPSRWPDLIQFLRKAEVNLEGSSILPLLLPLPLPRGWAMWRVDSAELEQKLTEEMASRHSAA